MTHDLASLDLHDVHMRDTGILPVRCLPPHQRRVTVLAPAGALAQNDEVTDRGVTMRVCGRAPWADARTVIERPDLADREAWTLHRVLKGQTR